MSAELAVPAARPSRLHKVTVTDMAWTAAVIDLKGAVSYKKNKMRATPQVVLRVDTKDGRVARRLAGLTGTYPEPHGGPLKEDFLRRGCSDHCPDAHVHYEWHMPETTRWSLTGISMAVVLLNTAPYMTTFDEYAGDVAGVIVSFAARGQGSGAVRASVSRLEQLGWKIPPEIRRRVGGGK